LAGEIRSIAQVIPRINEAEKLGFKHCVLPKNNYKSLDYSAVAGSREMRDKKDAIELIPVSTLREALDIAIVRV
jgi:DNA repair protein RadA/Sms